MMLCCGQKIKIEANFAKTPITCSICKSNISLEDMPISPSLRQELKSWNLSFSKWLIDNNWNTMGEFFELESKHNQWGATLYTQLKKELSPQISTIFSPSNLSQNMYA